MVYARIAQDGDGVRRQWLQDHLMNAANHMAFNLDRVQLGSLGFLTGVLHDAGKAKASFQSYLMESDAEKQAAMRGKVIHSRLGARIVFDIAGIDENGVSEADPYIYYTAQLIAAVIMGHHTGLQDIFSLDGVFTECKSAYDGDAEDDEALQWFYSNVNPRAQLEEYFVKAVEEVNAYLQRMTSSVSQYESVQKRAYVRAAQSHLVAFLGAHLVDADRKDAMEFDTKVSASDIVHEEFPDWEGMLGLLEEHLASLHSDTIIGAMRDKLSDNCAAAGEKERGVYSLWAPTGFGKSFASLRFGLKHADKHELKHIIYVIPYMSIIDQMADEFSGILRSWNVLEHHSSYQPKGDVGYIKQIEYLQQRWARPVVLTTMVQLLNSVYSMQNTSLRHMQALSDSVIIFDEIQNLPRSCIYPFFLLVEFLKSLGSTVVLCSATQPNFEKMPFSLKTDGEIGGLTQADADILQRIYIEDWSIHHGALDGSALALLVTQRPERASLTVHNTKRSAELHYEAMKSCVDEKSRVFLLTTNLCPAHRKRVIAEIKDALTDEDYERVYVVSTQLIQAGVDLSFDIVFRAQAGLDDIIQAGGRCNRHGLLDKSPVIVFTSKDENLKSLPDIQATQKAYRSALMWACNHGMTLERQEVLDWYYTSLLTDDNAKRFEYRGIEYRGHKNLTDSLYEIYVKGGKAHAKAISRSRKTGVIPCLTTPFGSIGDCFEVIQRAADEMTVYVAYDDESLDIISQLQRTDLTAGQLKLLLKKAQQYAVTDYVSNGLDGLYQVNGMFFANEYDTETGLVRRELGRAEFI